MTIEEAIKTAIEYESRLRDIYLEAAAAEENPIKVQYRAERSPLVTVRSGQ